MPSEELRILGSQQWVPTGKQPNLGLEQLALRLIKRKYRIIQLEAPKLNLLKLGIPRSFQVA